LPGHVVKALTNHGLYSAGSRTLLVTPKNVLSIYPKQPQTDVVIDSRTSRVFVAAGGSREIIFF